MAGLVETISLALSIEMPPVSVPLSRICPVMVLWVTLMPLVVIMPVLVLLTLPVSSC